MIPAAGATTTTTAEFEGMTNDVVPVTPWRRKVFVTVLYTSCSPDPTSRVTLVSDPYGLK